MKGVCHVEVNDYGELIRTEGYKVLLTLPSYVVIQHPKTFHTVLYACKRHPRSEEWVRKCLAQYTIPGLASDVNVSIPAGMWQEWVKKTKKPSVETGYVDVENYPPPPPTPSRTYRVNPASGVVTQELYDRLRNNLQSATSAYNAVSPAAGPDQD